ncbi:MAG: nucleotidyltransferase [Ignavibacteria bacterium]|nr:nucleotidyltransferase [Ignavibacteriota bacterium]
MTEELETLKRVVDKLEIGQFNYLLTGSMAMSFYSVPRMTRDSDIVIQLFENQISRFIELFEEEFYTDRYMLEDSLKNQIMFNIFDKKTFFKIDFILKTDDFYDNVKFDRKKKLKINGLDIYVISIEDLIISKLMWARDSFSEMQLTDIRELLKIGCDIDYVNEWVTKLDLKEIYIRI